VGGRLNSNEEAAALATLREQVAALQLPQIAHRRRAIVLFEGPEGSGKKAALRQFAGALDPCHFMVHATQRDRRQEAEGHWLARFWRQLPGSGDTAIFYRSWYRRVLDERIRGELDGGALARTFDEINEFEAQQRDYGTLIVKLYFDVTAEVQRARLRERAADPWQGMLRREPPVTVDEPGYAEALADLRTYSDTRWSPWRIIDGDDEQQATIAALGALADAWAAAMPAEPPHLIGTASRAA
jgi:polyphosphate kinase 2 (PPK2 family)